MNPTKSIIFDASKREVMLPLFERHLDHFFSSASCIQKIDIQSKLKYQHNYNLIYQVSLQRSDGSLFKKTVYGKSALVVSTQPAFQFLRYLWEHGFNHNPYRANRPLGYFKKYNLTLYESLVGPILTTQLKKHSKKWTKDRCAQAAGWLKKCHNLPHQKTGLLTMDNSVLFKRLFLSLEHIPKKDFINERKQLVQWAKIIHSYFRAVNIPSSVSITHGDFGQHNVVVMQKGIGVIDFDTAALYDPAIDVGSFLVQIVHGEPNLRHFSKWSDREIQFLERRILQTYRFRNPITKDPLWEVRVEIFRIFFLLKVALHVLTWLSVSPKQKKLKIQDTLEAIDASLNRLKSFDVK